jgi:hypothetical protein
VKDFKAPPNEPMGVRDAETMQISFFINPFKNERYLMATNV